MPNKTIDALRRSHQRGQTDPVACTKMSGNERSKVTGHGSAMHRENASLPATMSSDRMGRSYCGCGYITQCSTYKWYSNILWDGQNGRVIRVCFCNTTLVQVTNGNGRYNMAGAFPLQLILSDGTN